MGSEGIQAKRILRMTIQLPDGQILQYNQPGMGHPPRGPFRSAEPPPETDNPEIQAAYLDYLRILTEQEKMEVERMKLTNIGEQHKLAHSEAALYLKGLEEIRTALGQHSFDEDNKGGLGDKPSLLPAFELINRGRLQQRYLDLYDEYVRVRFKMKVEPKLPIG